METWEIVKMLPCIFLYFWEAFNKNQNKDNDSIAYVNLKKCVEKGKTSSNYYDIRDYVWREHRY